MTVPYRGPSAEALAEGIQAGQRPLLARAITLVESTNPHHRETALELLSKVGPLAGKAHRIGITGVPGVGKSTFIESLGLKLIQRGHRVAVLAVDPSSTRTGGSILADKTRMTRLSQNAAAYIRPSPSRGTLGGVTTVTRETMTLVEAAGFDVVLVETVGVGQSETVVSEMVDFFLVLMIAGAGDEFQGIKKGVLELADLVAINKADGDGIQKAQQAAAEYRSALNIMTPHHAVWKPPVVTCSAQTTEGLDDLWSHVTNHQERLTQSGHWTAKRNQQQLRWVWAMVKEQLMHRLDTNSQVKSARPSIESEVLAGKLPPVEAAQRILDAFDTH